MLEEHSVWRRRLELYGLNINPGVYVLKTQSLLPCNCHVMSSLEGNWVTHALPMGLD